MRTNIVIDDKLIKRASGLNTKRAAVEAGLRLLIQIKAQRDIRQLRGRVQWVGNLNEMRDEWRIKENPVSKVAL
ncbi:MAG: type II toxin-antitoxin system VapB family antitoxin [Chloroflexi bacterium]|nr:type II toxin-antitoxin system VapB family antitoxin [Chloroflexota bacterium]